MQHEHIVLVRLFDVVPGTVFDIVLIVLGRPLRLRHGLTRCVDGHRSARSFAQRGPTDEPTLVGTRDNLNAVLALQNGSSDGIVNVTFASVFQHIEFLAHAAQNFQERQRKIFSAHVLQTHPGICLEHGRIELHYFRRFGLCNLILFTSHGLFAPLDNGFLSDVGPKQLHGELIASFTTLLNKGA